MPSIKRDTYDKRVNLPEDKTKLNGHVPNNRASKYMKQKLRELITWKTGKQQRKNKTINWFFENRQ